jgi:prevent-host-death family protein
MNGFGVCDAKANFSALIDRARSGRATVITRRGRVVAPIVPAAEHKWDRSEGHDELEVLPRRLKVTRRLKLADPLADGGL